MANKLFFSFSFFTSLLTKLMSLLMSFTSKLAGHLAIKLVKSGLNSWLLPFYWLALCDSSFYFSFIIDDSPFLSVCMCFVLCAICSYVVFSLCRVLKKEIVLNIPKVNFEI